MSEAQISTIRTESPAPALAWILLLLLGFMWGSSYFLIKRGLLAYEPEMVAGLRVVVTFLCLLPFALFSLRAAKRRHIFPLAVVGVVGTALPAILFAVAQTHIPSAVTGIMNSLTPLFTLIVAALIFKIRFGYRSVIGVLFGLAGAVMIIIAGAGVGDGGNPLYGILIVLATVAYAFSTNYMKYRLADLKPVQTMSLALMFAAPAYIVYLLLNAGELWTVTTTHPEAFSSLASIILLGSLGTAFAIVMFAKLVQMCSPVFAVSVTYLIPIVSLMWGVLDGEQISWPQILGLLTILGGVYLVNSRPLASAAATNKKSGKGLIAHVRRKVK
jgi:drug/metabolite transporter (DMT)-like permease